MDFGKWLRAFMMSKNIIQADVVKKINTSYDFLKEVFEQGKIPNDQWLYNFAVAFDLDINEVRAKAGKDPIEGLPEKKINNEGLELQEIKEQCKNLNAKIDNLTHMIEHIELNPFLKGKGKKIVAK